MAIGLTCPKCGKSKRYDKSEINMSGSIFTMNYAVPCAFCGEIIRGSHTIGGHEDTIKEGQAKVISID